MKRAFFVISSLMIFVSALANAKVRVNDLPALETFCTGIAKKFVARDQQMKDLADQLASAKKKGDDAIISMTESSIQNLHDDPIPARCTVTLKSDFQSEIWGQSGLECLKKAKETCDALLSYEQNKPKVVAVGKCDQLIKNTDIFPVLNLSKKGLVTINDPWNKKTQPIDMANSGVKHHDSLICFDNRIHGSQNKEIYKIYFCTNKDGLIMSYLITEVKGEPILSCSSKTTIEGSVSEEVVIDIPSGKSTDMGK